MRHAEPIAATEVWRAVIARASGRCQCTGACGSRHSKDGLRCGHFNGEARKNGQTRFLSAAPADPLTPPEAAVRLPVAELLAWCPECWTAAVRRHRAAEKRFAERHAPAEALFEI